MTPENIRFHAAGHLAAAYELAKGGYAESAGFVLRVVASYMHEYNVDCPPPMLASILDYAKNPAAHLNDIEAMEALFTHPANTALEQAGIRI